MFIDMPNLGKINLLPREIEKIKTNFFESERMKKWSRLDIANNFNITTGKLKEKKWDDLRRSMQSHAVLIWAKFFDIEKYSLCQKGTHQGCFYNNSGGPKKTL